ncbi:MAG: flagellin [Chloroflexi bacterium]|nr:flagellin [Chloroflexota bacterium]
MTVNGHVFTFDTGSATNTANTIGLAGKGNTGASIAMAITQAVNDQIANGDSAVNAIATVDGTTITLYHEDFGTPTGTTSMGVGGFGGASTISVSSWAAQTIGNNVGAYSVLDSQNNYELQIRGSLTGNNNQIRLVNPNGGSIAELGSGTTLTTGTTILYDTAGAVDDWALVDAASEWAQTQNAAGTTNWEGADILTQSAAQKALAALDTAINRKDIARANLGAIQNRLENTITNLQIQAENLQAAESRISDADIATEMTEYTRNNILAQAAVSMLAQANSLPQLALQLLQA